MTGRKKKDQEQLDLFEEEFEDNWVEVDDEPELPPSEPFDESDETDVDFEEFEDDLLD